jgi:Tol biopolymer transport system component
MASRGTTDERLDGWEAISHYLGWHPRTVIRWEKQKGLPVHRVAGGKRQPVYAYRSEIDRWFRIAGGASLSLTVASGALEPGLTSESSPPTLHWRISRFATQAAVAAAIVLILAVGIAWRLPTQPAIEVNGISQLTSNGTAKRNLVTDGKQLYFSEKAGGEEVLSTVAANGGPIRQIALPVPNPEPQDLSPDGKLLLLLSRQGHEEEHPLWIVPTTGGEPYQVPGIRSQAASWSPNGQWIAYASGSTIYLVSPDGRRSHELSRLSGIPQGLRWSADGKHLLVLVRKIPAWTISLWQLDFDDSPNTGLAAPSRLLVSDCCRTDYLARGADGYFSVTNQSMGEQHLSYLRPHRWWEGRSLQVTELGTRLGKIDGLAADPTSRKLYLLSGDHAQGELVRYDRASQSFTMVLPGIAATFVDYAKNAGWITYTRPSDNTLWLSRTDGSGAKQLSPAGMNVELPRWSPDGKWIAFMGKQGDRPWRIFVIPAVGGIPKEASKGNDNQGAPTWSHDGESLIYGNVHCQEEQTCAIHKIDVESGRVTTLPDSQGLATARWSPDGRYIAALNPVRREVYVFDLGRQKWRWLAGGVNGDDLNWSSDSRYLYAASSMSGQAKILRVPVDSGNVEAVLNLDSLSKSVGYLGPWFSLTPGDSIILNRWLDGSEIYALSYRNR